MSKFDRVLWRINGTLFLVCLFAGILYLGSTIDQTFFRSAAHPPNAGFVREEPGTQDKESLKLGSPTRIVGTSFLRLPLQGEGDSGSSLSTRGRTGRVYNYLYLDVANLSSWWVFKGSDQLISRVQDLRVETAERDRPATATLFGVIPADTDDDHQITGNDREAIYFAGADGRNPFEILPPVDYVLAIEPIFQDQFLIIYQRGADTMGTVYSAQNGTRLRESTLAAGGK